MKTRLFARFLMLALACAMLPGQGASQRAEFGARTEKEDTKGPYVPGELLVKMRGGSESRAAESRAAINANKAVGAEQVEVLGFADWQRVKLPVGLTVEAAAAVYETLEGVEYAQPNYYYHLLLTPNDPSYTSTGMYGLGKISAPAAWDLSTGSSSIVVVDIDSGLHYTHQDLAANTWVNPGEIPGNNIDDDGNGFIDDIRGWDFFYNDSNPIDDGCGSSACGHGTHTAGTIGAVGNNALNVVGVNWNVKILPIKIYSPLGTDSTSAMLVNSYAYVRMMKLRGVNIVATSNSYGGCGEACGYDQATKDGIDAMGDAGIVNVFAAGNDNNNNDSNPSLSYPSVYTSPSIIAVASSQNTTGETRSSFSSYGLTSVDLAAPGSSILSTWHTSNTATFTISGTSMATPHVTGAVALLAAYRPELSAASLKASILNNVDLLTAWTGLVKTGGRLNVFKAMQNPTVCTFDTGGSTGMSLRGKSYDLTLSVTAAQNCDYMAKSSTPSWLTVTGNNVFSGNGTITLHVDANTTGSARTGVISFGGRTYTLTQRTLTRSPRG